MTTGIPVRGPQATPGVMCINCHESHLDQWRCNVECGLIRGKRGVIISCLLLQTYVGGLMKLGGEEHASGFNLGSVSVFVNCSPWICTVSLTRQATDSRDKGIRSSHSTSVAQCCLGFTGRTIECFVGSGIETAPLSSAQSSRLRACMAETMAPKIIAPRKCPRAGGGEGGRDVTKVS